MRAVALWLVLAGGCASVIGIDDWSTSSATSSTGPGGAGGTGAGGTGADTGGAAGSTSSSTAGAGGGGGAETCDGPIGCWSLGNKSAAPCDPTPAKGTCIPEAWDLCGCDGIVPAAFLEFDAAGTLVRATLIAPTADAPYSLGINSNLCAYGPSDECSATACGGENGFYTWVAPFGNHDVSADVLSELRFWRDDAGAPCNQGAGGSDTGEMFLIIPNL